MNVMIEVRNIEHAEPAMLCDALSEVAHRIAAQSTVITVQIEVRPRVAKDAPAWEHPGHLHYTITYRFADQMATSTHMLHNNVGSAARPANAYPEFHDE